MTNDQWENNSHQHNQFSHKERLRQHDHNYKIPPEFPVKHTRINNDQQRKNYGHNKYNNVRNRIGNNRTDLRRRFQQKFSEHSLTKENETTINIFRLLKQGKRPNSTDVKPSIINLYNRQQN